MKKVLLSVLVITIIVSGFAVWYVLNLPEYALGTMMKEVKQDGVSAIEPYLTDGMLSLFQTAQAIAENPLMKYLITTDYGAQVLNVLDDVSLEWKLESIARSRESAVAFLNLTSDSFSGSMCIDMVREDGQWLICDISIPVTNWVFKR